MIIVCQKRVYKPLVFFTIIFIKVKNKNYYLEDDPFMKVKDLQPKQAKVNIEVEVKAIGDIREFQKFGNTGKVANAVVADDSGKIKLTLWNDDIDKIRVGDKLKITNGFVSEFQGEKQLSAGRFGKLEVKGQKK